MTSRTTEQALWRCYELSGADVSDDHGMPASTWREYAVAEVEALRHEHDEMRDWIFEAITYLKGFRVASGEVLATLPADFRPYD